MFFAKAKLDCKINKISLFYSWKTPINAKFQQFRKDID